jgi:hypothetical protein
LSGEHLGKAEIEPLDRSVGRTLMFAGLRSPWIFVNSSGNVLRAAVRSPVFDVVLASLLLHEHSHLLGATECEALRAELDWLTSEHADSNVIQATRRSIDLTGQNGTKRRLAEADRPVASSRRHEH